MNQIPDYAVQFRGEWACPCLTEWIPAYERELQRRGVLVGQLPIFQLIGFFSGSGGTHSEGGAFDVTDIRSDLDVWVARQMGADATWPRTAAQGFTPHLHGVLRGCPHNEPARYQIDAVDGGFNGLGDGGRGGLDDGPRPLSGRTWREGIEWQRQQEDDMADPATQAQLDRIEAAAKDARDQIAALRGAEADRAKATRNRDGEIAAALDALVGQIETRAAKAQVQKIKTLLLEHTTTEES